MHYQGCCVYDLFSNAGGHDRLPLAHVRKLSVHRDSLIEPCLAARKFGGITSTEDGSALKAGPTAGSSNGGNSRCVKVLVNSGA